MKTKRKPSQGTKKVPTKKGTKKERDLYEEILETLKKYDKGNPPRTTEDYEVCSCDNHG